VIPVEEDPVPLRQRLSYKFLLSTAVFILAIEAILLVMSVYGFEWRLFELRKLLAERARNMPDPTAELLLPTAEIYERAQVYARNVVVMVAAIVFAVLSGIYFVLNHWILSPLQLILDKNKQTQEGGTPELIPEDEIPNDEIGMIMKSRNRMLTTLQDIFDEEIIETLVKAVDAKDEYTRGHSQRVGELGRMIGEEMDLSSDELDKLQYSGTLHDIGKIGLDDEILTADRGLTDEEFEAIQKHPDRGAEIIGYNAFDEQIINGIRHHHERYDGGGYPDELEGDDIPLFARILGVADAVDAMLSNRHYRNALSEQQTIEELEENAGSQFDPEIAPIGVRLLKEDQHTHLFQ
jgi:HD-GYP domain-containing protein (c-di-GMP phosphodiesterase class II)